MNQAKKLITEIATFLFGRKYYANIVNTRGLAKCEISSFIFLSRKDALRHRDALNDNRSFKFVQTITFRSRYDYQNLTTYYH